MQIGFLMTPQQQPPVSKTVVAVESAIKMNPYMQQQQRDNCPNTIIFAS
jgi:hypothetical protein